MKRTLLAGLAIVVSSTVGGFVAQQTNHVSAAGQTAAGYVALNPSRVYDSRQRGYALGAGEQVTIQTGRPGSSAVGVNIVMTDTGGPGFLTAWASGPRPTASVINASGPGENIANFLLVPVAADGSFQIYTLNPTHVVIDIMGYMDGGGSALVVPTGFSGYITGYGPIYTITSVVGTVTNGTSAELDLRADVQCPNGTVETDYVFNIPAGGVRGWEVLCDGVFTSGATVTFIEF